MADLCLSCGEYVGQNDEGSPYCKCHREELKELKEIAEKYKLMMTPTAKDIEKALQIVERLKKLDLKKKIDEAYFNCNRDHPETREILANLSNDIQKILGEKK